MIKRLLAITLLAFFVFSLNTLALGTDSGEIDIGEIVSSDILGDINLDDELDADDIAIFNHTDHTARCGFRRDMTNTRAARGTAEASVGDECDT